jgi:hypothetical protein
MFKKVLSKNGYVFASQVVQLQLFFKILWY